MTKPLTPMDYIKSFKLDDVLKDVDILSLEDKATVAQTISFLAKYKLRSVPILNTSNKKMPHKILGLIGAVDILYFILQLAPNPTILTKRELKTLFLEGEKISEEKAYKLINKSGLNPLDTLLNTASVHHVASKVLSKGVHRVLIVDENDRIVNTLSRTDILRLIKKGIEDELDYFGKLPIKGSVWKQKTADEMIKVVESDSVLLALDKLRETKHKSVPVVNDKGELVGNFSSSDIKTLVNDAWPSFAESIEDFSKQYNPNGTVSFINSGATISDAIHQMIGTKSKRHCIWVVDDNKQVVGSVSMTDILRYAAVFAFPKPSPKEGEEAPKETKK